MDFWLRLVLSFALSCFCVGNCLGLNVTNEVLANAWQSSWFTSDGCFRNSSARPGQWDYFHSSGTPDASGYQWLLLKLKRPVPVRSVTVYGRLESPASERVRAQGIEIMISNHKPTELTESSPRCTASFSHSLTGFKLCGVTKNSTNSNLAYEVSCSAPYYSKLAHLLLLRKFVANQTDKYMNFKMLRIEAAYFCKTSRNNCSIEELSNLVLNEKIIVKAWLPCNSAMYEATNCSIKMRSSADVMTLSIKRNLSDFVILNDFNMTWEMHDATLQCRHSCSDSTHKETSQTLEIRNCKTGKSSELSSLDLSITKHWVVNETAVFSFNTNDSFPKSQLNCALKVNREELFVILINYTSYKSRSSSAFRRKFFFKIRLLPAYRDATISCGVTCSSSTKVELVSQQIPQLVEPCKTRFVPPPNSSWIDGKTINLTVDSSERNWVPTSHLCFLHSEGVKNLTLKAVSSTNSSSMFSVRVSRDWGSSASVACLVNQSGLIETWAGHPLPPAFYPVSKASIRLATTQIRANSSAQFLIYASEVGNPPAKHSCSVSGRALTKIATPSPSSATSLWELKAQAIYDGRKIRCQIVQMADSSTVLFNMSVSSNKLDVIHQSNSSWNLTQPLLMKEGEGLSFSLKSGGGNPKPSHRCWLNSTADSMEELAALIGVQNDPQKNILESIFRLNSSRPMNGGEVVCRVSQGNITDLARAFHQSVTVHYPIGNASIKFLPGEALNGSQVDVVLLAFDRGNPPAQHSCSLAGRNLTNKRAPSETNASSLWTFKAQASDNGMRICCQLVQAHANSSVVFNKSVSSENVTVLYASSNWWTATQPLVVKETEPLSFSVLSEGGNPEPSHLCWLWSSNGRNISLNGSRATQQHQSNQQRKLLETKFSITSRRWMNGGSVMCRVSQEAIRKDDTILRQNITVYYSMQNASVQLPLEPIRNGSEVRVTLLVSDQGNPRGKLHCSIAGKNISQTQRFLQTAASSVLTFKAEISHNGERVSCQVLQVAANGSTVFNTSVNSHALNVLYASANSWTANRSLVVNEGQSLSVSLRSVGGNPDPSHQCWLQTASGGNVSMTAGIRSNATKSNEKVIETSFTMNSSRKMNGGLVMCRFHQAELPNFNNIFRQNVTVFYQPVPPEIMGLSNRSIYEGLNVSFSVRSGDGNPSITHNCTVEPETKVNIQSVSRSSKGFETNMSFIPDRRRSSVRCTAVQMYNTTETLFERSLLTNISVKYLANNSLLAETNNGIPEGITLNVTLVSVDGRPAVRNLSCWVGQTELSETEKAKQELPGASVKKSKSFLLLASREHHNKNLSCKFEQDEQLIEWKNTSLVIFYEPNVILSQSSFNGTSFAGTLQISDCNPNPRANCSGNGDQLQSQSSRVLAQNSSNHGTETNSFLIGAASHSLAHSLGEHNDVINITCVIWQQGYWNFTRTYFWVLNSSIESPTQPPITEQQKELKKLLFLLLLLIPLLITAPILIHRRHFTASLDHLGQPKESLPSNVDGRTSLELEQEYMKSHYLYRNLNNTEYATVIGSGPDLADSLETVYEQIVGHLDDDGNMVFA